MTIDERRPRRRIKVRGGPLGWFLCWAVVFADIGSSIYYTPGILHDQFGSWSSLFVLMTTVVFMLLSIKYAEVTWRYPEGGGVVNVTSRALHPFAGLLGGSFIVVSYYLTIALSALSGFYYLSVIVPSLYSVAVPVTMIALFVLGLLNLAGVKESAVVSATFALLAGAGQLVLVIATAIYLGPAGIAHSFGAVGHGGRPFTPLLLITGYGAAFLAFSGLETITQLAPAMRAPRRRIAAQAMLVVVVTMVVTSPLLSLWSTTLLAASANENQFISLLGAHVSGAVLADYVAVSGSLLLVFASNTGLIGAYHVFIALSSMGFLPRAIEHRNKLRGTPHWAIILAIALPILIVGVTRGNTTLLGDLYGFGLLGAFALTCISLDVVRWRDGSARKGIKGRVIFVAGVLTTGLVLTGWLVNLVAKPIATYFGGGLALLGVLIGLITYNYLRSRQPVVFPTLRRPGRPLVPKAGTHLMGDCDVLAILPADPETAESVVTAAVTTAGSRPLVFLYRGHQPSETEAELLEVTDPYLRDRPAQVAFARAEAQARKSVPSRQYVYLPGDFRRESVGEVWKDLSPAETLVVDGDQEMLPPIALDRVRRTYVDGYPVLHLLSGRRKAPAPAS